MKRIHHTCTSVELPMYIVHQTAILYPVLFKEESLKFDLTFCCCHFCFQCKQSLSTRCGVAHFNMNQLSIRWPIGFDKLP